MAIGMYVPLTDAEEKVLNELAAAQDLSPDRIMIQGLRLTQLVHTKSAELLFNLPPKSLPLGGMVWRVATLGGPMVEVTTEAEAKDALWEFAQSWPSVGVTLRSVPEGG